MQPITYLLIGTTATFMMTTALFARWWMNRKHMAQALLMRLMELGQVPDTVTMQNLGLSVLMMNHAKLKRGLGWHGKGKP